MPAFEKTSQKLLREASLTEAIQPVIFALIEGSLPANMLRTAQHPLAF
jgi:hypothetical protein